MANQIDILGVSLTKDSVPKEAPDDIFMSLEEYREFATKTLMSYRKKYGVDLVYELIRNEDSLSHIMYSIMISDWRAGGNFDGYKGGHNGHRRSSATFQIMDIIKRRAKNYKKEIYDLDVENDNGVKYVDNIPEDQAPVENAIIAKEIVEKIDELVADKKISEKGVRYLKKTFLEGKTRAEIMEEEGIENKQAYYQLMNDTCRKLRGYIKRDFK